MGKSLRIVLLVITVLGMTLGGALVWVRWQPRRPVPPSPAVGAAPARPERCATIVQPSERARCQAGGYDRWLLLVKRSAVELKNHQRCGIIPDDGDRDVCLLEFVDTLPRSEVCAQVADPARRQDCNLRIVSQGSDFSACNNFLDAASRDYCLSKVLLQTQGGGLQLCPTLTGADQERCWEMYYTAQAVRTVDYDLCDRVPNVAGRSRCLQALPTDTDGDKLSDYAERAVYRTNPNNPDTDGDGYADGVEVRNGFDPKGPGRLKP